MNKADTVSAVTELMVYWEKWAITMYLNESGTVDARLEYWEENDLSELPFNAGPRG